MKKKEALIWIPFYVDKWLFGSTRLELKPDEQSVFVDFMCLAAKDSGFIRANEGFPYPLQRLSEMLGKPVELVERTINRCFECLDSEGNPKITHMPDGTLYITNWENYKFSDRYIRRIKEQQSITQHNIAGPKPGTEFPKKEQCSEKEELNAIPPHKRIDFDFNKGEFTGIIDADWKRWAERYPAVDIKTELGALAEWMFTNPDRKKSNWARFIANNLSRKQDKGGSRGLTGKADMEDRKLSELIKRRQEERKK